MSITIKNCFYEKLTFKKLYEAHIRARKGKTFKAEIIKFEINLENNLINLLNNIKNGTYNIGKYNVFYVNEPKEREIKALPYVDRIVHQWYIEESIKPYIVPRLITGTYACIDNRGTHAAVDKVQSDMKKINRNLNGDFWILKCDIKKFFNSINPNILLNILSKFITDKKLLSFTKLLIFSNATTNQVGIPIRKLYISIFCKYLLK
ncbi:MAG: reverse transcriptase domain-containing protein [Clostridia bacterium]